jgi:hypothetical protein
VCRVFLICGKTGKTDKLIQSLHITLVHIIPAERSGTRGNSCPLRQRQHEELVSGLSRTTIKRGGRAKASMFVPVIDRQRIAESERLKPRGSGLTKLPKCPGRVCFFRLNRGRQTWRTGKMVFIN